MELALYVRTNALWNILIRVKYGEDQGGWCTKMVRVGHGVGVWKELRKGWELVVGKWYLWWVMEAGCFLRRISVVGQ